MIRWSFSRPAPPRNQTAHHSEKAALRRALQACACSDSPTRLAPALMTAESLVRTAATPKSFVQRWRSAGVERIREQRPAADLSSLGKNSNNLGITALDVRSNSENASQRAVYVNVANFAATAWRPNELLLDGKLLETRPLTVAAGRLHTSLHCGPAA